MRVKSGGPVTVDELKQLLDELKAIATQASLSDRQEAEQVRFCRWPGQSKDGRKRKDAIGKAPKPFEGASDARIRAADLVIRLRSAILMKALSQAMVRIQGMESGDERRAAKIRTMVKWMMRGRRGEQMRREFEKAISFGFGDSPGVAFLGTWWDAPVTCRAVEVTPQDVMAALNPPTEESPADGAPAEAAPDAGEASAPEGGGAAAASGAPDSASRDVLTLLTLPELEADAVALITAAGIPEKHARDCAKAFQKGEAFRWEKPVQLPGRPLVCAYRLWDDLWLPANVRDLQRAPLIVLREWLTRDECEARVVTHGWSESFVKQLCGKPAREGQADSKGFAGQSVLNTQSDSVSDTAGELATANTNPREGLFEVLTAFFMGTNDDGVVSRYMVQFSGHVKTEAATPRMLLDYDHGQYPFTAFTAETLGHSLLESRGTPELAMTDQLSLKLLNDSFEDHVQLVTLPPVKRLKGMVQAQVTMSPMGVVEEIRPGEIETLKLGEYPRANEGHREEVRRRFAEYFGLPHPEVPQQMTGLLNQEMVDRFLASARNVMLQAIALFAQYASPEEQQRVMGGEPIAPEQLREGGEFDFDLYFDVDDLDPDSLKKKAEMYQAIVRPLDAKANVRWDKVVQRIMYRIDANLAEEAFVPAEVAAQQEVDQAEMDFVRIAAGIEPPMADVGRDWQTRIATVERIVKRNPEAYQRLSETSRKILQGYLRNAQFQLQQLTNAQTGRFGATPVLTEG